MWCRTCEYGALIYCHQLCFFILFEIFLVPNMMSDFQLKHVHFKYEETPELIKLSVLAGFLWSHLCRGRVACCLIIVRYYRNAGSHLVSINRVLKGRAHHCSWMGVGFQVPTCSLLMCSCLGWRRVPHYCQTGMEVGRTLLSLVGVKSQLTTLPSLTPPGGKCRYFITAWQV